MNRLTILLADNEKVIRTLLRVALERRNHEVLEAADGNRALALARQHGGSIDVLLADVSLPKLNGFELAERLESERDGLKVMLMSAAPCAGRERRVLRKPFEVPALLTELDTEAARKPPQRAEPSLSAKAGNGN